MGKLMLYMHNDIFLTDIVGYDQLKFIPLEKNEILGTPLGLSPKEHAWSATVYKRLRLVQWTILQGVKRNKTWKLSGI